MDIDVNDIDGWLEMAYEDRFIADTDGIDDSEEDEEEA